MTELNLILDNIQYLKALETFYKSCIFTRTNQAV